MIYLLIGTVAFATLATMAGGMYLIGEGIGQKNLRAGVAGALALIAFFTVTAWAADTLDNNEKHCGIGTKYVYQPNNHWYCKAERNY